MPNAGKLEQQSVCPQSGLFAHLSPRRDSLVAMVVCGSWGANREKVEEAISNGL